MLKSLKLLLPALLPSWNFFDSIGPSPRIEYALLLTPEDQSPNWREFRPRPANLPFAAMLGRVFWNPRWNENLFLVSCAEKIVDAPTEHSIQEVFQRIQTHLIKSGDNCDAAPWLQFRLLFASRRDAQIETDVLFVSPVRRRALVCP